MFADDFFMGCFDSESCGRHSLTLSGRPPRDTIITHDDQINLKIALETTSSVEEFLALV